MDFKIEGEWIELCSLLKVSGLVESGGDAKQQIAEGFVKVNGVIETRKRGKIKPGSTVEYKGTMINLK
jgi:ribosome-associated protein